MIRNSHFKFITNTFLSLVNSPVITLYSFFWLLLIIVIAGGFTWLFYYKSLMSSDLTKVKLVFLSLLRFTVLVFLGFLLLSPFIRVVTKKSQKPLIIFAQDNSASMILSKDSTFLRDSFQDLLEPHLQRLSQKYNIKTLQFGDSVGPLTFSFTDKETNFENLFHEFNSTYFNQNIGALIIASDGLYNKGTHPVYASQNLSFPIYTIPFGDTLLNIDLAIAKIDYNKVVYKGATFPVVVSVAANGLLGNQMQVQIMHNNKALQSKSINISNNSFFTKIPFYLKADSSGVLQYQIVISANVSEANSANNSKKIIIEVEESKRKILLLQNGYHPDVAVFKRIINVNSAFELEIANPGDVKTDFSKYALIILHQLPSQKNSLQNILPDILTNEIPLLFVLGQESSVPALNNLNSLLKINQKNKLFDEVLPQLNKDFSLFNLTIDNNLFNELTPLFVPFGDFTQLPVNQVLLYQQIGQIATNKPLWAFAESGKQKMGYILGEGIWKWRMQEYKSFRDHAITNELIIKTIQYLALKNKKAPFVLNYPKSLNENQQFIIGAKLFNESNELVKGADIKLNITDESSNLYQHTFKETSIDYSLNLGEMGVGKYKFTASTKLGDKTFVKNGILIVNENVIEQSNLIADFNMLFKLSQNSNAKMFNKMQLDQLVSTIENNSKIVTIDYMQKTLKELISIKYLLLILIIALGIEWFLRKYWGII